MYPFVVAFLSIGSLPCPYTMLTGILCGCCSTIVRLSFEEAVQLEKLTLMVGAPANTQTNMQHEWLSMYVLI